MSQGENGWHLQTTTEDLQWFLKDFACNHHNKVFLYTKPECDDTFGYNDCYLLLSICSWNSVLAIYHKPSLFHNLELHHDFACICCLIFGFDLHWTHHKCNYCNIMGLCFYIGCHFPSSWALWIQVFYNWKSEGSGLRWESTKCTDMSLVIYFINTNYGIALVLFLIILLALLDLGATHLLHVLY